MKYKIVICDKCHGEGSLRERPDTSASMEWRKLSDGLPLILTGNVKLEDFELTTCEKCNGTGSQKIPAS